MRNASESVLTFAQQHEYRRQATLERSTCSDGVMVQILAEHEDAWREMRRGACTWVAAQLGQSGEAQTEVARILIAQIAEEIL